MPLMCTDGSWRNDPVKFLFTESGFHSTIQLDCAEVSGMKDKDLIRIHSVTRPEFAMQCKCISIDELEDLTFHEKTFMAYLGLYEDDSGTQYLIFMSHDTKQWYCIKR